MPKRKDKLIVEKRLSFEQAIKGTSLENCLQENLDALGKGNCQKVQATDPKSLRKSVDIDTCVKNEYPNANRWDYAIVYRPAREEEIYYVEIHPATLNEVETVIKKKMWLGAWINNQAPALWRLNNQFYWIASGSTMILTNSKEFRELASNGIKLAGRVLILPSE
jgi:hypothetical protein